MRGAILAGLSLLCLALPAHADSCTNLAATARAALSMKGLDDQTKTELEQLLEASKSGDPMRCESATSSIFQSSPEGERQKRLYRCKDEQNSV